MPGAGRIIDWGTARTVGERIGGLGQVLSPADRARVREDFEELVPEAEALVRDLTGLSYGSYPARPWVMQRGDWIGQNLRAFESLMEPYADRLLPKGGEGTLARARRSTLGAQVGALMGYVSRRVLGQYDPFLPPDDDGLIYFVAPNIVSLERKHGFPRREFRLWISLHEVAHRLQFGGVPWLRGYIRSLVDAYVTTMDLDPRRVLERVRQAAGQVRDGSVEWRGLGWVFLLMSPDQRETFRRMQAVMALLEGHGNYAMNEAAPNRVPNAAGFRQRLHERRTQPGLDRTFQRVVGLEAKMRQYGLGERFVTEAVKRSGREGFNRVWDGPENLPTMEEIGRPEAWVARVASP
jgi:coenzyme F420 biosynthesis associated uncharacterized protein